MNSFVYDISSPKGGIKNEEDEGLVLKKSVAWLRQRRECGQRVLQNQITAGCHNIQNTDSQAFRCFLL